MNMCLKLFFGFAIKKHDDSLSVWLPPLLLLPRSTLAVVEAVLLDEPSSSDVP
jgi:hypothetical protein